MILEGAAQTWDFLQWILKLKIRYALGWQKWLKVQFLWASTSIWYLKKEFKFLPPLSPFFNAKIKWDNSIRWGWSPLSACNCFNLLLFSDSFMLCLVFLSLLNFPGSGLFSVLRDPQVQGNCSKGKLGNDHFELLPFHLKAWLVPFNVILLLMRTSACPAFWDQ